MLYYKHVTCKWQSLESADGLQLKTFLSEGINSPGCFTIDCVVLLKLRNTESQPAFEVV